MIFMDKYFQFSPAQCIFYKLEKSDQKLVLHVMGEYRTTRSAEKRPEKLATNCYIDIEVIS